MGILSLLDVRPEIRAFAMLMEAQKQENERAGEWSKETPRQTAERVLDDADALFNAVRGRNEILPGVVLESAANTALSAMTVAIVCDELPTVLDKDVMELAGLLKRSAAMLDRATLRGEVAAAKVIRSAVTQIVTVAREESAPNAIIHAFMDPILRIAEAIETGEELPIELKPRAKAKTVPPVVETPEPIAFVVADKGYTDGPITLKHPMLPQVPTMSGLVEITFEQFLDLMARFQDPELALPPAPMPSYEKGSPE